MDRKGYENQAADNQSRLENEGIKEEELMINDSFPDEQVIVATIDLLPSCADNRNYHVSDII